MKQLPVEFGQFGRRSLARLPNRKCAPQSTSTGKHKRPGRKKRNADDATCLREQNSIGARKNLGGGQLRGRGWSPGRKGPLRGGFQAREEAQRSEQGREKTAAGIDITTVARHRYEIHLNSSYRFLRDDIAAIGRGGQKEGDRY